MEAPVLVVLLLEGLFRSLFLDRVIGRVIGRIQVLSSFASAIVPSELATVLPPVSVTHL